MLETSSDSVSDDEQVYLAWGSKKQRIFLNLLSLLDDKYFVHSWVCRSCDASF